MKCDADSHPPIGCLAQVPRGGDVVPLGCDAGERVQGEDLDGGVVLAARTVARIATSRCSAPATWSEASSAASRHSPSAACSPPPAARCQAVAASSAARAGARCPSRPQDAPEMDAGERRPGARRRWLRPSRSRAPAWPRRSRSRRPGTARGRGWRVGRPRSAGSRAVPTFPLPDRGGGRRRRSDARSGPARPGSRRGGLQATGRRRVRSQCSTWSRASTARTWSPAEIAARAAKSQFAA